MMCKRAELLNDDFERGGKEGTMTKDIADRLDKFAESAWNARYPSAYDSWQRKVLAFLRAAKRSEDAEDLVRLGGKVNSSNWEVYRDQQVSHLEGLAILLRSAPTTEGIQQNGAPTSSTRNTRKVFLVHGHDAETKESVARFLTRLDLEPIILHEQANRSQTIIEKFEANADVGYAIVLLTPDDNVRGDDNQDAGLWRARQNVILELGYFIGRLGRPRVCALYKEGVELPSDFQGVLYVPYDEHGAWRQKIAQELIDAKMPIRVEGLFS